MSNNQVAKALQELGAKFKGVTPTGKVQVDKKSLETISKKAKRKKARKLAADVLLARSVQHDMSSVVGIGKSSDGVRVYPNLRIIGAKTGRSSCSSPNLQQLNKNTGDPRVRGIMMADKGTVIASVDYQNIEVRTIAELSGDKKLVKAMMNGLDVHSTLAAQIYGKDFTPKNRMHTKNGVFAMLFGASTETMADTAGCSVEEAEGIKSAWNKLYPIAGRQSEKWDDIASRRGHTTLSNGWQPDVGYRNGKVAGYRATNYQVQGNAAFIFREGVLQLARAGLWPYVRMVVHDEFVLSLPRGRAEKIMKRVMKAATVKHPTMTYTTDGEIHGKYWGMKNG